MNRPEISAEHKTRETKLFDSSEDFPNDPKQEGLRPNGFYAGGNPDEIIVVNGKKYSKEVAMKASDEKGRPYSEKAFFSHFTEDVGTGPGWDYRSGYLKALEDGGCNIDASSLDSKQLSDLPLYRLIPFEQQ